MNTQDLEHRLEAHHLTTATEQLIALVDEALHAWHECLDERCCRQ